MTTQKITIKTTVLADKQKTWDYYTGSEHIIHWNFADPSWHCPTASNDLTIGGQLRTRMEAKDGSFGFDFIAFYTEINPRENFSYEFGGRIATIVFHEANGQTEVVVTFDPETENSLELQKNGWQAILDNFKAYTENN